MKINKYKMIFIGIFLGIFIWICEAVIHFLFFHAEGDLMTYLIFLDVHEFWIRSIIIFLILIFSIVAQIMINKIKETNEKLMLSEENVKEAFNHLEFYKDLIVHDINNILSNILASTELFTMYLDDPESQTKLKEITNIINDQGKKGVFLISNIQTISDLEKLELPIQSIEICELLKEAILLVKSEFLERDIDIHVEIFNREIFIQTSSLIMGVFRNILNNAVKYNDNQLVEIFVRISNGQKEGKEYLKFEFIDNGLGVADNRKKDIFKRGNKKDKHVRGMGIGLSLVKKFIERYNGQIWIEDKVKGDHSKGSNFIFLIPDSS